MEQQQTPYYDATDLTLRAALLGFRTRKQPLRYLHSAAGDAAVELSRKDYYVRRLVGLKLIECVTASSAGGRGTYRITGRGNFARYFLVTGLMICTCCGKSFHPGRRDYIYCANCQWQRCSLSKQRCKD